MSFSRVNFFKHLAQTSPEPLALEIADAQGMYLMDTSGKKYMDLIAGIGVSVLGHKHPALIKAVRTQVEKYVHTMVYGEFILSPQVELATELTKILPSGLNSVYLVNSGTEAIEGAMKLAKRYSGRKKFVAAKKSYHGSTQGAMSLISEDWFAQPFRPMLPSVEFISFNNFDDLAAIDEHTAAVILETVKAEEGVIAPVNGYLEAVQSRCKEAGALLILDEIQAGYGRTGKMFAFEHYSVSPDIICLAKAFGGGMPIGAFISDKKIMSSLTHDPVLGHITTYGGNPVCAAAALATLRTIQSEKYIEKIPSKSALISKILDQANLNYKSAGLWYAVDAGNFKNVISIVKKGLSEGLLVDWFLFNQNSIRIAPPLIISEAEIEDGITRLAGIISDHLR